METRNSIRLFAVILAGVALAVLTVANLPALASHDEAVADSQRIEVAAPSEQRSAPYGQHLITHNARVITTTQDMGTVARTAGYDINKAIFCDVGDYDVTIDLYGRISSTGGVYTISTGTVLPANTRTISNFTQIAPWMSIGATSEVTGSTTTCGIWVQTP